MHCIPSIQMFGDVPPRPRFRKFRRYENALKFALRMDMSKRLFKEAQPVITQTFAGRTYHFVNYRNRV
jgi:hypothetical protein